ncbi:hypothetical protein [Siminovitchia sp. 179-K 8D1 HS]|uniref:hypothetical protein n=1 Tax=Siminovitchia sp. 179-K 8D1 HS TaxID=3142385 RepID=UPI0039A08CBB
MAEMTVSRGLAELKLLDARINRTINESVFGSYTEGKKLPAGFNSVEEVEKQAKSDLQSAKDLIKRRNEIKSAIVQSNAVTKIKVAGKEYTVAEAIERKSSIDYDIQLLNKLKHTYATLTSKVDRINEDVKQRLDSHLEALYGKEGKNKALENAEIVKAFKEDNEAKLIDPINLKEKIDQLTKEIEDFEMEVDHSLTTSNAITTIEVSD